MKKSNCAVFCLLFAIIINNVNVYGEVRLNCCGLDMPVLFEDQSLSSIVQEAIIEDYQLIFGHLEADGRWTLRRKIESEINDIRFTVLEGIMFKGSYKTRPDDFKEELMLISVEQKTQAEHIFIPEHLSDKAKNEAAFAKLDEFIDFMNNIEEEVSTRNITDPRVFINFTRESKLPSGYFDREDVVDDYIEAYKDATFKKYSLLEIKEGAGHLIEERKAAGSKWAESIEGLDEVLYYTKIIALRENIYHSSGLSVQKMGVVYFENGGWKLLP